ncbi:hypothetical protein CK477_11760 [Enterobacter cloacae]|nr:hypothetical protein CK477_11760 [Enterobacter cloacae]
MAKTFGCVRFVYLPQAPPARIFHAG